MMRTLRIQCGSGAFLRMEAGDGGGGDAFVQAFPHRLRSSDGMGDPVIPGVVGWGWGVAEGVL